jgi:hypothetical protein
MGSEAWDRTLRATTDVGTEPSITLRSSSKARSAAETENPTSPSRKRQDRLQEAPVRSGEDKLHAAGFRKRGGAWRR